MERHKLTQEVSPKLETETVLGEKMDAVKRATRKEEVRRRTIRNCGLEEPDLLLKRPNLYEKAVVKDEMEEKMIKNPEIDNIEPTKEKKEAPLIDCFLDRRSETADVLGQYNETAEAKETREQLARRIAEDYGNKVGYQKPWAYGFKDGTFCTEKMVFDALMAMNIGDVIYFYGAEKPKNVEVKKLNPEEYRKRLKLISFFVRTADPKWCFSNEQKNLGKPFSYLEKLFSDE